MTLSTLEKAIWHECQDVVCNSKLRLKDLLEWSTSELKPEDDSEVVVKLPQLHFWVCIKREHDLRKIGGVK